LAGAGKTSLVKAYGEWLESSGYSVAYVNLDPGAKVLPYEPDLDVREYFTIEELMVERGLGPNGAFLAASEKLAELSEELVGRVSRLSEESDYVLVDTPGQMEMFVYREGGRLFVSKLKSAVPRTFSFFVVDGEYANRPQDLAVSLATAILVQVRLDIAVVPVVNKGDLVKDRELVEKLLKSPSALLEALLEGEGLGADVALRLAELVGEFSRAVRPVVVSAARGEGMEELHALAHEVFCACGDLT